MRFAFLAILMTGAMLALITWAARPDVLQAQYERITAPIQQHYAEQREAAWQQAKEQARRQWMARAPLSSDCARPASALHALECKNQQQLQAAAFENDWANRVASGWRPDGVN